MDELERFIVSAKSATYVGGGTKSISCRVGSHDLAYEDGNWKYLDSYFGGIDFLGQEVVWYASEPVWAMNYHGFITRPDLIDAAQAGEVIKSSLAKMYKEGRFLGEFSNKIGQFKYSDSATGDYRRFFGAEQIEAAGIIAYQLRYHGGLVIE